ncbi:MAG: hypothetical protein II180_07880 [Proteobacteria bacterium]|nr:hypothetical protein [Pseudomonadota bacterium]
MLKLTLAVACVSLLFAPSCKKQDNGNTTNDADAIENTANSINTANPNADDNHNHMLDKYEVANDQGADCAEKHNAGCIDEFCDSYYAYNRRAYRRQQA